MSDHLYLTGFMGCGKSTVAPLLSRILGYDCIDIDAMIENRQGKTVREIYSTEGEAAFRVLEKAALRETAEMKNVVVSLGGGTLVFGENHLFVKSTGRLIYLKVDFETLLSRIQTNEERPLVSGPSGSPPGAERLKQRMETLFAEREPYYNTADLVVEAGNRNPGEVATFIAATLTTLS